MQRNGVVRDVKDATGILHKSMDLFLKPFEYLANSEYITPQMKAELRQQAIEQGFLPREAQAQALVRVTTTRRPNNCSTCGDLFLTKLSAEWIETKAFDCFGRELETQQCEYCGQVKPVKLWKGIENCRDSYNILMVEYIGREGHKTWTCKECYTDIADRT